MADGLSAAQQRRLNPNVTTSTSGAGIAGSNGGNIGPVGLANQADAQPPKEPRAPSPFNLAGGIIPADLGSAVNLVSKFDPAGVFDHGDKNLVTQQGTSGIRKNPLNEFLNYTYNIKLGVMTPDMLNAFNDGDYDSLDQNIMIASGGILKERRAAYFDVDFYIDDLDLNSIIGLNKVTGGSNATSINFTITEPGGLTFFNRLLALCQDMGIKNYLDVPYSLSIQFKGYDNIEDSNTFKESSVPFITPIKFTEIQHRVSKSGGEYDVQAVAYSDSALFSNECSIHENFSSKSKTVGDFFNDLTEFYNNYYKVSLEKQKKADPDIVAGDNFCHTIKFEIDDEIKNAPIKFNNDVKSADKTSMVPTPQGAFDVTASHAFIDAQKKIPSGDIKIDFSAGTNIIKMINTIIIQQSSYIKSQKLSPENINKIGNMTDPKVKQAALEKLSEDVGKPLSWFRTRNKKTIKQFNVSLQKYARENTFVISKYNVSNRTVASYPGWGETKPVKRYDYIFTGKNDSVIDFNIKFDALYYQQVLGNPAKYVLASGEVTRSGDTGNRVSKTDAGDSQTTSGIQPQQSENTNADIESGQATESSDYEQQDDRVLINNQYTNSMGDMVEVKLTIIGDPDFLVGYNENVIAGNSLNILNSEDELTCLINYKSPQDWDENTGMLVKSNNPAYFDSAYSGVYKIIEVNSNFSGGQFTQVLTTVRLFNQPGLGTEPKKSGGNVTSIGSTIAGSLSSFSPGTSVFTGLAANMPALQSDADNLSAGIPGIQSNIVTSNGSSVFTGLAANTNARAPATQTASQNQTALTKAQTRAIQTGSFKTGFNQ